MDILTDDNKTKKNSNKWPLTQRLLQRQKKAIKKTIKTDICLQSNFLFRILTLMLDAT